MPHLKTDYYSLYIHFHKKKPINEANQPPQSLY